MAQLNYKTGTGAYDYVACIIAPAPPAGMDKDVFHSPALRVLDISDPVPDTGVQVDVPAGAPHLVAALRDVDGNVPTGVTVTVTQPDGTVLNQATEPYDPEVVVEVQGGSLVGLDVPNPQSGTWTIQMVSTNTQDEYQFFFSTIPTQDVQDTIDATLESMADAEAIDRLADIIGVSRKCFWCKIGCYALGVVILALLAAGATYITAGAAPVVALAGFLGVAATTAVASLIALASAVGLTIGIVCANICAWAGVCPSPATA